MPGFECQASRTGKLHTGHSRCGQWKGRILSLLALTCCQCSSRGSPGCCQPSMLLSHVQLAVNQEAQVLLCKATSQSLGHQQSPSRAVHFPLLTFLRFLSVCASSLSRSLNNSITVATNHSSKFPVTFKLAECALCYITMSFHQGISQY